MWNFEAKVGKKRRVTLSNDVHDTKVTVYLVEESMGFRGTTKQAERIKETLCGRSDCSCGGISGPQEEDQLRFNGWGLGYGFLIRKMYHTKKRNK